MGRPETPRLTADIIIELDDRENRPVVLIQRRNPPLGYAIPGGFVDVGETVEQAALREAFEETGLSVDELRLLGVYSDPARDPRGHTVSVVFVAVGRGLPRPGDDAADIIIVDPTKPPATAFDHDRILADYCRRMRSKT